MTERNAKRNDFPKALILNGAESDNSFEDAVNKKIVLSLAQNGWQVESIDLRNKNIAYCCGLFYCWTKTPGVCSKDDFAREIARKIVESNLVVFITPITFGGYSWQLKKALDRIICIISPFFTKFHGETHHRKRYDNYPDILAFGIEYTDDLICRDTFKTLIGRNALNFHCRKHRAEIINGSSSDKVESTNILNNALKEWCK